MARKIDQIKRENAVITAIAEAIADDGAAISTVVSIGPRAGRSRARSVVLVRAPTKTNA